MFTINLYLGTMLGLLHQHATVAAKSVPDICDPTRLEEWSTRGAMTSSSTRASIIWGIIGPLRMFGQDELLLPFLKCIGLYAHRMNMEVGAHGPEGKKTASLQHRRSCPSPPSLSSPSSLRSPSASSVAGGRPTSWCDGGRRSCSYLSSMPLPRAATTVNQGSVPTKHETSNKEKHTFRVSDRSSNIYSLYSLSSHFFMFH
jgi:hypothetical protein